MFTKSLGGSTNEEAHESPQKANSSKKKKSSDNQTNDKKDLLGIFKITTRKISYVKNYHRPDLIIDEGGGDNDPKDRKNPKANSKSIMKTRKKEDDEGSSPTASPYRKKTIQRTVSHSAVKAKEEYRKRGAVVEEKAIKCEKCNRLIHGKICFNCSGRRT